MEYVYIDKELSNMLQTRKHTVYKDSFVKRITIDTQFDSLAIVNENQNLLKEEYYAFINRIYLDDENNKAAIGCNHYEEYQTFYDSFVKRKCKNDIVILDVIDAVFALDSLGVDYWDIHPCILIFIYFFNTLMQIIWSRKKVLIDFRNECIRL